MLEMPDLEDTDQEELQTGCEISPRNRSVLVNKSNWSWRSEDHFDIRHGDTEHGVCPAIFLHCLSPIFPHYAPFSPF